MAEAMPADSLVRSALPQRLCNLERPLDALQARNLEGIVATTPLHLLCPGGEHERIWLEDVIQVTKDGGRPFFSWGFDPLIR